MTIEELAEMIVTESGLGQNTEAIITKADLVKYTKDLIELAEAGNLASSKSVTRHILTGVGLGIGVYVTYGYLKKKRAQKQFIEEE